MKNIKNIPAPGSVIEKAKESCETFGNIVPDHFVDANKMVFLGSDARSEVKDILLTRVCRLPHHTEW
jgi:hypothetical protein